MNPILKLKDIGQSCWLDNLTRAQIRGGELKMLVTKQGIRGVTTNPSIFSKAISKGSDYDDQISQLAGQKLPLQDIYEAIAVKDVQDACDILRPVYDESAGADGFVSLEVSPYLAHDSEGTLKEAQRLFKAVDRPNCLIKIPGTPACIPAIEASLYQGINVNITLLFSVESYEAVAETYVRALHKRAADGKSVSDVASVASFFLSRIDTLVDQLLGHLIIPAGNERSSPNPQQLFGKAAVASAKLAYQSFKRIFSGERWRALVAKGAKVQRPLWASTSTKDPLYSDVAYVTPLIGIHTINTMPENTIAAFMDHGVAEPNTIEQDVDEARRVFCDLEDLGISLDFVSRQLINEGIQKFIDPFDKLMLDLDNKVLQSLGEETARQVIYVGAAAGTSTLSSLGSKQVAQRLHGKDPYLWTEDREIAKSIGNRLGWLDCVESFRTNIDEITAFAQEIRDAQITHVVLAGMGGSSLCTEVCRETFGIGDGWPELTVLDNTAPAAIRAVRSKIDLKKTLFMIASKSGTTKESISFYRYFYDQVKRKVKGNPGDHFIAITDTDTPLATEAAQKGFRRVFLNPGDIGGRYSALSYFGLAPMALMGIDIGALLDNARQMLLRSGPSVPPESNPAMFLGTFLGESRKKGRDKITFVHSKSLEAFGLWAEQLIAESTGKDGLGIVPVVGEALSKPEHYGDDRIFLFIYTDQDDNRKILKKLSALEKAGHPVVKINIGDKLGLGGEFLRWEIATAIAGCIMGVNPFDEPNVTESKNNTAILLDEWKQRGSFTEGPPIIANDGLTLFCSEKTQTIFTGRPVSVAESVETFLGSAAPSTYIAILPYLHTGSSEHKKLQTLRHRIRDRFNVATTLGYGPRYLHSTGQLHKGGPATGLFIILTSDSGREIPIPGEDYGFATLHRAQALGDFRSLADKGRPVIRIHLGKGARFEQIFQ